MRQKEAETRDKQGQGQGQHKGGDFIEVPDQMDGLQTKSNAGLQTTAPRHFISSLPPAVGIADAGSSRWEAATQRPAAPSCATAAGLPS